MSELTRCNYCSLRDMHRRADERGVKVIVSNDDGWVSARFSDSDEPSAWFLQLTSHCVC